MKKYIESQCDFEEATLVKLEKRLKVKLPQDYVDFLRVNNGGSPLIKQLWHDKSRNISLYIQYIFAMSQEDYDLLDSLKSFPDKLDVGLMPIILEGSGCYIILDCKTNDILLWDADELLEQPVTNEMLQKLATGIVEFMEGLEKGN